jgi:hypothetical protein
VRLIKGRGEPWRAGHALEGMPEADLAAAQEESGSGTTEVGDDGWTPPVGESGWWRRDAARCWAMCKAGLRLAVERRRTGARR